MAAQVRDADWLAWIAKLMGVSAAPIDAASRICPDSFYCLLDEQPSHLVPERLLRQSRGISLERALHLNPDCRLSTGSDGGGMAWIADPMTSSCVPFWLGPRLTATVQGLQNDPSSVSTLSEGVRATLNTAGILVSHRSTDLRRQAWATNSQQCRTKFQESGYAPINGLIHPFHVAALRRYYRRQIRKGAIRLGDQQSPHRYVAHNEPVARFFHVQLTKTVSDLLGQPVKPSYVYMAAYQSGARLEKHTDREQCAFSITFCVDYSPEPAGATPWPLHLDTPRGTVTVYQALGDGLLYRGRELPHYRGTLAQGNSSTSIFFHYVAEDFSGSLT